LKTYLFLLIFLLVWLPIAAQKKPCVSKFDSISVVNYIEEKGWLDLIPVKTLAKLSYFPEVVSTASLNQATCRWKVVSQASYHSNDGDCRFTNGCTVVVKQAIVVNARNKRLVSRRKNMKIYPNFE